MVIYAILFFQRSFPIEAVDDANFSTLVTHPTTYKKVLVGGAGTDGGGDSGGVLILVYSPLNETGTINVAGGIGGNGGAKGGGSTNQDGGKGVEMVLMGSGGIYNIHRLYSSAIHSIMQKVICI